MDVADPFFDQAAEDSETEEDEPCDGQMAMIAESSASTASELSREVCAILKQKSPGLFASVSVDTFSATPEHGYMMRLCDPSCGMDYMMVYPTCSIIDEEASEPVCSLVDVKIKGMHNVCTALARSTVMDLSRDNLGLCQLRGWDPKGPVSCVISGMFTQNKCITAVEINGKKQSISKSQIELIRKLVESQSADQVAAAMGASAGTWFQQVNITNVFVLKASADDDTHTSNELVVALLASDPELASRIVHAPNGLDNRSMHIFYCNPLNNHWGRADHIVLEELVVGALLAQRDQLTKSDIKKIEGDAAFKILRILARKCSDPTFEARLDADLDLFALDNCVFDMKVRDFRPIQVRDVVSTTAGWSYSREEAIEHRAAVDEFCMQVLPVQAERAVVLAYFASLLSGRRELRKFIAFTDERKGANGKSTFFKLLQSFFGEYVVSSAKFVGKPKYENGRDSHGGGTENFRGKRLVVAEELKSDTVLDMQMFKTYTGGANVVVQDRCFGKGSLYKFIWQAGFLLIFNEGDCPQFDAGDSSFMERMVIAPFRSKFVTGDTSNEPLTYLMDKSIDAKFGVWRSAFADILIASLDSSALDDERIPKEMTQWRDAICAAANPAALWIIDQLEVTGSREHIVDLKRLGEDYMSSKRPSLTSKEFCKNAKAYLMAQPGVTYQKEKENVVVDGVRTSRTNTFRGVRFNVVEPVGRAVQ